MTRRRALGVALLAFALLPVPAANAAWRARVPVPGATVTVDAADLVTPGATDPHAQTWDTVIGGYSGPSQPSLYANVGNPQPAPVLRSLGQRPISYRVTAVTASVGGIALDAAVPIQVAVRAISGSVCDESAFDAAAGQQVFGPTQVATGTVTGAPSRTLTSESPSERLCARYTVGDASGLPDLAGLWGRTVTTTLTFQAATAPATSWLSAPATWQQSFGVYVPPPVKPASGTACSAAGILATGSMTLNWGWPTAADSGGSAIQHADGFRIRLGDTILTDAQIASPTSLSTNGLARSARIDFGLIQGVLTTLLGLLGASVPVTVTAIAAGTESVPLAIGTLVRAPIVASFSCT